MCVSSCAPPLKRSEWGTDFRLIRSSSWSGNEERKVCWEFPTTSLEMPFQCFPWVWNKTKVWFHWLENYKSKNAELAANLAVVQFYLARPHHLNLSTGSSLPRQVARCNSSNATFPWMENRLRASASPKLQVVHTFTRRVHLHPFIVLTAITANADLTHRWRRPAAKRANLHCRDIESSTRSYFLLCLVKQFRILIQN